MNLLDDNDGWFEITTHPQQHYFFKNVSLCKLFKELPEGSHHDNVPLKHCKKCEDMIKRLMSVAEQITGKKFKPKEVFKLIEALGSIDLKKGSTKKVKTPENTVAVIKHSDGSKQTVENKKS